MSNPPIQTPEDLVTPREAIRTGFIILALEKNRLATPHVAEARALQETARQVKTPSELISIEEIQILHSASSKEELTLLVQMNTGKLLAQH